jgi:hypothetical protein
MLQGHLRQVIAIIPSRNLVILRMRLTREDIGYSVARLLHAIVGAPVEQMMRLLAGQASRPLLRWHKADH